MLSLLPAGRHRNGLHAAKYCVCAKIVPFSRACVFFLFSLHPFAEGSRFLLAFLPDLSPVCSFPGYCLVALQNQAPGRKMAEKRKQNRCSFNTASASRFGDRAESLEESGEMGGLVGEMR